MIVRINAKKGFFLKEQTLSDRLIFYHTNEIGSLLEILVIYYFHHMINSFSRFNRFRDLISLSVIAFINCLFTLKYGARVKSEIVTVTAILLSGSIPFFIYFLSHRKENSFTRKMFESKLLLIAVPMLISLTTIVFYLVCPQTSLRVDRYEMIRLFFDNAFSGNCPYCPREIGTNIPGPYPFYFFAAFPFYKAGEIGYYSLSGAVLFFCILLFGKNLSLRSKNTILLLFLVSPALWWELTCRSTIFLNSAMVISGILLINHDFNSQRKKILFTGIVLGLILATRSISFLLLGLAFIYKFKSRLLCKESVSIWITAAFIFILTFVPVVLLCKADFLKFNPFAVQSTLAPPTLVLSAIAVGSMFFTFRCKELTSFYAILGYVCFLIVAGYGVKMCIENGVEEAVFNSSMDISYFIFSLPFLLLSLSKETQNGYFSARYAPLNLSSFSVRK